MKKLKYFLVGLLSVSFLAALLIGCGSDSPDELIVGRWFYEEETSAGFEFFSDGTAIGFDGNDSTEVDWSISEDTLKLANPSGHDVLLTNIEELTENRLVLSVEDQELVLVKE